MLLYYVDPHRMHSRRYRALEEFGRSRSGQFLARHFVFRVDPWLYRLVGGPILLASNYAKPSHPAWNHNLKAHPECELATRRSSRPRSPISTRTVTCTRWPRRSTAATGTSA